MKNIILESQSGFFDQTSNSFTDLNGHISQIIHGNNRYGHNTGYTSIYFLHSFNPATDTDKIPPNISLELSGLEVNTNFTLSVNLWTNLNGDKIAQAAFYVESFPPTGEPTFFPDPFYIKEWEILEIPITIPTPDGIYCINIWGVYPNTNLWFELNSMQVVY